MKLKIKLMYEIDRGEENNSIELTKEIAKIIKEKTKLEQPPKWKIKVRTRRRKTNESI